MLGSSSELLYCNEGRMGKNQGEPGTCMWLQGCDVAVILEMWWDCRHDWKAAMGGCRFFRTCRGDEEGLLSSVRHQHRALPGDG